MTDLPSMHSKTGMVKNGDVQIGGFYPYAASIMARIAQT